MALKVLFHHEADDPLRELVAQAGGDLDVAYCAPADADRFAELLPQAEVIWHVLRPLSARDIAGAPRLRLIQKFGVGVNTIDLEAARACGVAVCNMPGSNTQAVVEMTLLLILAALRRLPQLDRATRAGEGWSSGQAIARRGQEIAGRRVGLIGFGAVPRTLAPVLQTLGAEVVAYARRDVEAAGVKRLPFEEVVETSDILSLHLPATAETAGLMSRDVLRRMKAGAILVNTARGEIVDADALADALKAGRLGAAALDVFAPEPLWDRSPILGAPNAVLTPHVAWLTEETWKRCLARAVSNCARLGEGGLQEQGLLDQVV
jgi:phosphoglycerate dehydrogenase-like enzyme